MTLESNLDQPLAQEGLHFQQVVDEDVARLVVVEQRQRLRFSGHAASQARLLNLNKKGVGIRMYILTLYFVLVTVIELNSTQGAKFKAVSWLFRFIRKNEHIEVNLKRWSLIPVLIVKDIGNEPSNAT